jgi:MinD-like ATPase involved in chromosome partitioning or flagellar assembly
LCHAKTASCEKIAIMGENIIWVGGGKGGVGKSIISMTILDYLTARGKSALLVESDTSNPDVFKAYGDALPCELINLDVADGWIQLVNTCDTHRDKVIVVNTAARNNFGVAKFGKTLLSSLSELGRKLIVVWAINRQRDSLQLLKEFLDSMPSATVHVARNMYFGDESKFELYAASKTVKPLIESSGGKSVNFPELADRVADDLYTDRLTIAAAVEKLPMGNRAELRRWRSVVAEMLSGIVES